MKIKTVYTIVATLILSTCISAQFPIRIPKIRIPKAETPNTQKPTATETNDAAVTSTRNIGQAAKSSRQMVMDDGYTFFKAEPVKVRNSRNDGDVDNGWYLVPKLRLMGTFPDNSAFRLRIRQNGKELSSFICGAMIYRSKEDRQISPKYRENAPYDDFMYEWSKCSNTDKAIKEIGLMDVEIYYIDGDTDKETLVRKHKIDVHKVAQIRGYRPKTYPGVSEYFIQRYAEAAVGIIYLDSGPARYQSATPFVRPGPSPIRETYGILMSYVLDKKTTFKTYIRCSINGKRIPIERDEAWLTSMGVGEFVETALMQRNDPKYSERITFAPLTGGFPATLSPGKWECSFIENSVTFRTIRFEVGPDSKIIPHPEQMNGNINLYHNAFLVEVEIPAGETEMDSRSMPIPDAGIFYGIPWSTPEGKAAATKVPKRGKPYPVMPK